MERKHLKPDIILEDSDYRIFIFDCGMTGFHNVDECLDRAEQYYNLVDSYVKDDVLYLATQKSNVTQDDISLSQLYTGIISCYHSSKPYYEANVTFENIRIDSDGFHILPMGFDIIIGTIPALDFTGAMLNEVEEMTGKRDEKLFQEIFNSFVDK